MQDPLATGFNIASFGKECSNFALMDKFDGSAWLIWHEAQPRKPCLHSRHAKLNIALKPFAKICTN